MSWVTRITLSESSAVSVRSVRRMRCCTTTSSAVTGSSASSRRGRSARARAIAARCFMPPESALGYASAKPSSLMRRMSSLDVLRRSGGGAFFIAGPNSMLRRTDSQGKSEYDWNTMPRSAPGSRVTWPFTSTSPSVGVTSPAAIMSSVDLPHPEGPTMHANWPSGTVSEIRSSAFTSP